jgi:CheY-like chemotaxis protein
VGRSGRAVTVLVAGDNDVSLRLCRRVLEKAGHKVLTASDGLEAVTLALANSPDMILLDDAMPGLNSPWATRQIKKQRPGIAIVVASVDPGASNRELYLAAGADDMLIKPIRLSDLLAVVAKLTEIVQRSGDTEELHVFVRATRGPITKVQRQKLLKERRSMLAIRIRGRIRSASLISESLRSQRHTAGSQFPTEQPNRGGVNAAVVGQREIAGQRPVATPRPKPADAQVRTVRHRVRESQASGFSN